MTDRCYLHASAAALALVLVGVITGCSSGSSTSNAGSAIRTTALTHSRERTAPQRRPGHRDGHRHRRAPSRPRRPPAVPAGTLAASTADPNTIQPQPPANSCHARGAGLLSLPDPHCTPGAIDPAVTPEMICRVGYSETVRPPESVTEPEKEASLAAYADRGPLGGYEYDHLVPLELGGARNDPRNLWPEPGASPNAKDAIENELHDAVCAGQIPLRVAQLAIARDWRHAGVSMPGLERSPAPSPPSSVSGGPPQGAGSSSHAGDASFCGSHQCIANFPNGRGTIVQCADGEWSHSGGLTGVCTDHGGPR